MSMNTRSSLSRIAVLLSLAGPGCSLTNRSGPDVTCADLQGGVNACADGIIASCLDGALVYEVCTEERYDVAPEDLCGGSWQIDGAYSCGDQPAVLIQLDSAGMQFGKLAPGTSGYLSLVFKNVGGDARGVQFTVSTDDGNVTLECGGSCGPGGQWPGRGYTYWDTSWLLTLDASAPRTPIPFQAVVADRDGHRWSHPFTLEVGEPER